MNGSRVFIFSVLVSLTAAGVCFGASLPQTTAKVDSNPEETTVPAWVFFADKGLNTIAEERIALDAARASLSPRCLARRAKVRGENLVDMMDVRVFRPYIHSVLETGAHHRTTSRWLNAVSVDATPEQITEIELLEFVAEVRPVGRGRRQPVDVAPAVPGKSGGTRYTVNYGECLSQLEPIQVPVLHDSGLSGAGVLVCILDTGFLREHDALVGINVVAEWDFINDDSVTYNEAGDPSSQHNHGTYTLSLVGGYDPGSLIGPAYGADYCLAKTEDVSSETPIEEDYWTEGIQWAESLGAEVASSSLTYSDWYTYEDMDGNTAVITIAADLAVENGIVVCNSAGNAGASSWHYIGAPADGDSVLAIGAVDSLGYLASWSSRGPTSDGRLKPDVCAMGVGTLIALPSNPHGYGRGSGTSFSCPITAGVCALLLESHPTWTPMELAEALKMTATNADTPDSNYGWGIVQASDADEYYLADVADRDLDGSHRTTGTSLLCYPNPCWESTTLSFALPGSRSSSIELKIYDARGRLVRDLVNSHSLAGAQSVRWDGRDEKGRRVAAGIYFAKLRVGSVVSRSSIVVLR